MGAPLPDTDGAHRDAPLGGGTHEPVIIGHLVSAGAWVATLLGWAALPDNTTVHAVAPVLAVIVQVVATVLTRSRVSPTGTVTLDGIRRTIRAMVWDEMDRLAGAAPAVTAAQVAAHLAGPPPAPEPVDSPTAATPVVAPPAPPTPAPTPAPSPAPAPPAQAPVAPPSAATSAPPPPAPAPSAQASPWAPEAQPTPGPGGAHARRPSLRVHPQPQPRPVTPPTSPTGTTVMPQVPTRRSTY